MLRMMRKVGLSSGVLYGMGFASIGASVGSWFMSRTSESAGIDRADRWGIFVGQWAPTLFALGCAMRLEEQWGSREPHEQEQMETIRERTRETMPVG